MRSLGRDSKASSANASSASSRSGSPQGGSAAPASYSLQRSVNGRLATANESRASSRPEFLQRGAAAPATFTSDQRKDAAAVPPATASSRPGFLQGGAAAPATFTSDRCEGAVAVPPATSAYCGDELEESPRSSAKRQKSEKNKRDRATARATQEAASRAKKQYAEEHQFVIDDETETAGGVVVAEPLQPMADGGGERVDNQAFDIGGDDERLSSDGGGGEGFAERGESRRIEILSSSSEDDISEEGSQHGFPNASGALARELANKVVIQLDTISVDDVWNLFLNKKLKGGYIARSAFIAGKALEPPQCPPWTGATTLAKKKREVADQASLFREWGSSKGVLEWLRLHVYITVREKPRTFTFLTVQHAGVAANTDGMVATLASIQATDDTMARIGHLSCDPDARLIPNLLFGAKTLEAMDGHDLQPDALWTQLADCFINNPDWDVATISVLQFDSIDVTRVPQAPGKMYTQH